MATQPNLQELVIRDDGTIATQEGRVITAVPVGRPMSFTLDYDGPPRFLQECLLRAVPVGADGFVLGEDQWFGAHNYNEKAVQYYRIVRHESATPNE